MGFLTDWFNKGELPQNFWEDSASGWHFHKKKLDWPLEENGEKVKAVLLKETFDSPAESDMMISMLAAFPASNTTKKRAAQERSSTAFPATARRCMCPRPCWRMRKIF